MPGAGEPRPDRFSKPVRSTPGESLTLPLEPSTQALGPDWASAWEPLLYAYVVNVPRQLLGGEPIVCTPLDALVMGSCLVEKRK